MGSLSVRLFTWLHNAPFYKALHQSAFDLIPHRTGGLWLDFGCGPGVLTRLAAQKGYHAIGLDADQAMIDKARKISKESAQLNSKFKQENLLALSSPLPLAEVVSASSLLAVISDRESAIKALLKCLKPGGTLLLIETTDKMRFITALKVYRKKGYGLRNLGLLLWGFARGGNSPASRLLKEYPFPGEVHIFPLLEGLVEAWVIVLR